MDLHTRFWSKIAKTNTCWIWEAALTGGGYGNFYLDGKFKRAHIVAWFLSHGSWPSLQLCHTCDNKRCVNPSHLFEGTQQDNMRDMVSKGRKKGGAQIGIKNHNAKKLALTREQAVEIQHSQDTIEALHVRYNVSVGTISNIRTGKHWLLK